jgi:DNA polymerase family B/Primase X
MIIKYNLSPETVNCSCCKNEPKAKEKLASEILKDCSHIPAKDEGLYWICQRRRGLFAKILQELTEQRIKYKNAGLEVESQAIKALINSGYGVFGNPYFKYHDPRVAELVTAFGRYTLNKMQALADEIGFSTLYGDTDSLFVNNVKSIDESNKFIAECKSKLEVDVTRDKMFSKLVLVGKKHYIGMPSDPTKEPIIKGMEGIKSDRPEFIHRVFRQLVEAIKNSVSPIPKLKQALYQLENRQVALELLGISLVLRKNPEEYDHICKQSRLGSKLRLRKGDTLVYYKCDISETVYDSKKKQDVLKRIYESENPQDISYAAYKKMFINSIRDVLQIFGYDTEEDLLLGHKTQLAHGSSYIKDTYVDTISASSIHTKTKNDNRVTIEQQQRNRKNIAYLLHDGKPFVLWSGHGYHIVISVNCKEALEHFREFTHYIDEPSKEFLQFSERHLSFNKADPANNPSFKSCLLRVPYTFNSKCIGERVDAEVKIIQTLDSSKPLPNIDNLLIEFHTFLVDQKLKAEIKQENRSKRHSRFSPIPITNTIPYVERLLEMSLKDYRKSSISLILAPYFVNVKKVSDTDSFNKIKQWVLKCNDVRKLEPSLEYLDGIIHKAIGRARETGIKPVKFEETLQYKNTELYNLLHQPKR